MGIQVSIRRQNGGIRGAASSVFEITLAGGMLHVQNHDLAGGLIDQIVDQVAVTPGHEFPSLPKLLRAPACGNSSKARRPS